MKNTIKLVIFDLDNTLTAGPTIWELVHRENKTWKSHGIPYWDDFKKGKFGFNAFINMDVRCWEGLPVTKIKQAIKKIKYIPNIKKTIQQLKKKKIKTALVSSSIELFAKTVAKKYGIDYVFANPLIVKKGKLTGKVKLKVPGSGKGKITGYLVRCLQLKKKEVAAVGDSKFDLPMFQKAGTKITFTDADPKIKHKAEHIISKKGLYKITKLLCK
ncbi:HAD family hydrolase [Candidatus Margulisiibacteriota bacterium]